MKRFFVLALVLLLAPLFASAESLYSPTWGFFLDLPEGYEYIDGDGKDRFSFSGPGDAMFDLVVYNGAFADLDALVNDVNRRLSNKGDADFFTYRDKKAALIELDFTHGKGWGLCVELYSENNRKPMLLALAYGPADNPDLELLHVSALDSICPSILERYYPGPIIEYSYPRGEIKPVVLKGGVNALVRENDAEAAQVLIEREFLILQLYANTDYWKDAWIRYYRFVFRDSWDRITNAASALVHSLDGDDVVSDEQKRAFAQRALTYIQGFEYERDFQGSDFFNLVTAAVEGVGNCDSHSMLWAIILAHAEIRSGIMISPHFSHAMGLADLEGIGARFEAYGIKWLVAETTDKIDIGLIDQAQSDPQYWFGIIFE